MSGAERARPRVRTIAAVLAGKALGSASRRLGRGGGTALPGVVAERIDPRLSARLARQLSLGRILVTGTNGKTTTTRLIAAAAAAAGREPVHNRSGSNLMRGIGTTLLEAAGATGTIPGATRRAAVLEVDEATLPHAVHAVRPTAVLFTNLFRDQLDRYGEVDSILSLWRQALKRLPDGAVIVLNADDPSIAALAQEYRGPAVFYGIDDAGGEAIGEEHAADARWCVACGTDYVYAPIYYGHLGRWRCPGCGRARPDTSVAASVVAQPASLAVAVRDRGVTVDLQVALTGLYNAYNVVAAYAGARAIGLPVAAISRAFAGFSAAFGRQERVEVDGREVWLLLCKNPTGTNQALGTVLAEEAPITLLAALNDGVQDGRDVSWIWDVDFERLAGRVARAVTTGTRAADMGLRLKYAGLGDEVRVEPDPARALNRALQDTPRGAKLFVLPTYTAMMELRATIAARGGREAFWRE